MDKIQTFTVKPGVRGYFFPGTKFNSILIKLIFVRPLDEDVTKASLLSRVLQRGGGRFNETLELERAFADNYGSTYSVGTKKIGERHLLELNVVMPDKKILGHEEGEKAFARNIELLRELVLQANSQDGLLHKEFVEQEKLSLAEEIRALYNDKEGWALRRCLELTFSGEAFSLPNLGFLEDIPEIDNAMLTEFYLKVRNTLPVEAYFSGDLSAEDIEYLKENLLNELPSREKPVYGPDRIALPEQIHEFVEHDNINQAKLVISMRTDIPYCSQLADAQVIFNAVFGGSPSSRIFRIVREKHSLAYYAHTLNYRHKSLMFITSGINAKDYGKVKELIEEILVDLQNNLITEAELDLGKNWVIDRLRGLDDSPGGNINQHISGLLYNCPQATADLIANLAAVKIEDIREVAKRVKFDTFFLLSPEEEDENNA